MPRCEATHKSNYAKAVQLVISYVDLNGPQVMREILRNDFKAKKLSELSPSQVVRLIDMLEKNLHPERKVIKQRARGGGLTTLINKLKELVS